MKLLLIAPSQCILISAKVHVFVGVVAIVGTGWMGDGQKSGHVQQPPRAVLMVVVVRNIMK